MQSKTLKKSSSVSKVPCASFCSDRMSPTTLIMAIVVLCYFPKPSQYRRNSFSFSLLSKNFVIRLPTIFFRILDTQGTMVIGRMSFKVVGLLTPGIELITA